MLDHSVSAVELSYSVGVSDLLLVVRYSAGVLRYPVGVQLR